MSEYKSDLEQFRAQLAKLAQKPNVGSSPPPPRSSSGATPPRIATALKALMAKLGAGLLRSLIFIRLVNGDNNLSLSNISVMIILIKLALATQLDFAQVAALLTVIGGYNWKRMINASV